jgi:hypothetical protein
MISAQVASTFHVVGMHGPLGNQVRDKQYGEEVTQDPKHGGF